jgi:putative ABC transport system permease protein
LLDATFVQGRSFLPEEDRLGASPAVILSHGFWQEHFGGETDVLGRILTLDGYPGEVVGILHEDFQFPPRLKGVDLYAPVELFAEGWIENRGNHPGLMGLARLRPGVSLERARDDMERVALELEAEFFDTNEGSRVHVAPLQERVTRSTRDPIILLLLAVSFLLLIACINVANLVLARATGRQQEMAVRGSLGAAQSRILRLLITETLVLWMIGGFLGVILARSGVGVVARLFAEELPPVFQVSLDLRVVGVTVGVTLLTGLIFGLVPALRVTRQDPHEYLKEGRRATGGIGRAWFRSALVVAEVSLAVALLVGAGLALRTFSRVLHTDPGLDPSNVLTAEIKLPDPRYPEESERTALYTGLLDRVRGLPGVVSAATMYVVPIGPGGWQNSFHVEGAPPEEGGAANFAEVSSVSTDYFRTMGISFLQGRDFTRRDNSEATGVVIVGKGMAERYWQDEDPIGKRLKWGGFESDNPWMEVVGVVGHVKVNGVVREAMPQLYVPHWQDNDNAYYLGIKTRGNPLDLIEPLRNIVLDLDPSLPLATVQTLDFYVRDAIRGERLMALLMGVLSCSALLLTAIGVYGVMAQMTAERRHEIGIRMALGARGDQVLRLVFRQGLTIIAIGLVLGLGLAVGVGKAMASQLFQVEPTDTLTFTLSSAVVVTIALAANLVPARRATRVNPVRALHTD